jgi:hypothetical protein
MFAFAPAVFLEARCPSRVNSPEIGWKIEFCKMNLLMAKKRMQVREHLTLGQFMPPDHSILIECKKCGQCATLRRFVFPGDKRSALRIGECSCLHCGRLWSEKAGPDFMTRGPLWLRMACRKNLLWILNRPHLEFMEEFIGAELREERMTELSSRRLSSALPRWMLARKSRNDVVHCLRKLREKLDATKVS